MNMAIEPDKDGIIEALAMQRNVALNEAAVAQGMVVALRKENEALQRRVEALLPAPPMEK